MASWHSELMMEYGAVLSGASRGTASDRGVRSSPLEAQSFLAARRPGGQNLHFAFFSGIKLAFQYVPFRPIWRAMPSGVFLDLPVLRHVNSLVFLLVLDGEIISLLSSKSSWA